MQKILVLRGGALGDFIVTLPALALLKQRWPAVRIELAGNATAASLAPELISAAHSQHEARWSALHGDTALPREFAAWLAEFDLVLSYWPDPHGELHRHFPRREGQRFFSASALPAQTPAAAHYCVPLDALGLRTTDYFYPLLLPRVSPAHSPGRLRIALHPGSGSPRKNWPLDRWRALGEWLRNELHAELVVVAGEAESPSVDALAGLGRIARNLPLSELARELAGCGLFLGHDSGVSHLAAACGVRSVLLFGPTDPAMWAPPASHVRVLRRGPEMNLISLVDVRDAVQSALADRT